MATARTITIVGGGLAGLSLGVALRKLNVPVTLWEAGRYPRHRVCGEFVSGRGAGVLGRLGLLPRCEQAGAFYARTALFVCGGRRSPIRTLEQPALCLSRYALDRLLAEAFQETGGQLLLGARWGESAAREGVVRASGRRLQHSAAASRWFGIKAHVPGDQFLKLEADLEMHVAADGYTGVNRIGNGETNVCGLFRSPGKKDRPDAKQDWLRGESGSLLHERLSEVHFDEASFCSVAGLQLRRQRARDLEECCIGDALTMTPPVTGNGMSMAFESAELAAEPLAAYSAGTADWAETRRRIARACDAAFGRRLAWARLLQWLMMTPLLRGPMGGICLKSNWLWDWMYGRTR